ncbi:MAG: hypothetical protein ICV62_13950 [Cyanobacteria bacterium Co-bin13]|nr:hypothetical protein [Cyanobacteria bacterium Co-bin13]
MNLKHLAGLVSSVVLLSAVGLMSCQAPQARASAVEPGAERAASPQELPTQGTAPQDLAQQIAQLEVERVLEGVRFTEDHPLIVHLETEQAALEELLLRLAPSGGERLITAATSQALRAKFSEVERDYLQDQALFIDAHPGQQHRKAQLEALNQRLAELQ